LSGEAAHPPGNDRQPVVRARTRRGWRTCRRYDARQESYVEDRFDVPVAMQEALARRLALAGGDRFRLPDDLARLLVSHAFLGQLNLNPVDPPGGAPGAQGTLKQCDFRAQVTNTGGNGTVWLEIEGKARAVGGSSDGQRGDGRRWQHEVTLTWEGIIEMDQARMARLLVLGRGFETLKWGNAFQELKGTADVTRLPAGHAIDLACGVRYGIVGEGVSAEDAATAEEAAAAQTGRSQPIPDPTVRPPSAPRS
jgi:hypothetical protein